MTFNPIVSLPVSLLQPATPLATSTTVSPATTTSTTTATTPSATTATPPSTNTAATTATATTTTATAVAQAAATQLAGAVAAATAVSATGDVADITVNPTSLPTSLVLEAVAAESATSQDSLAPLLADLTAALESTALPAAARSTAQQILAGQTPLNSNVTAASLQSAVASSGLFLEANLAAAADGETEAVNTTSDMKALLLQLTNSLDPATLDPTAVDPLTAAIAGASAQPRVQAQPRQRLPPRPPIAGAVTSATPVARASVGPDTSSQALTSSLRQETAAALARLTMSQLASVPKPGEATRWSFELPVETDGGLAMAQFEISRDDHKSASGAAAEPTWRARFSMDVEPNGPVHAEVSLSGGRTRATLWAERGEAHQVLDAGQDELTAALAETEGGDAAVRVVAGAPPDTTPQAPGRFIDRTS